MLFQAVPTQSTRLPRRQPTDLGQKMANSDSDLSDLSDSYDDDAIMQPSSEDEMPNDDGDEDELMSGGEGERDDVKSSVLLITEH